MIVGCTLFYIAAGILTPGSIAFGIMLAKIEGRWPVWSFTTAVCGVFISLIVFFNCCAWIVAAYRPETGADVIQSWYDWAWFAFLLGWVVYLAIEMIATALVELMDNREEPMVPRWLTWLTLAGAATLIFAAGPAFFKSGPFAYHRAAGLLLAGCYLGRVPRLDDVVDAQGTAAGTRIGICRALTRFDTRHRAFAFRRGMLVQWLNIHRAQARTAARNPSS